MQPAIGARFLFIDNSAVSLPFFYARHCTSWFFWFVVAYRGERCIRLGQLAGVCGTFHGNCASLGRAGCD